MGETTDSIVLTLSIRGSWNGPEIFWRSFAHPFSSSAATVTSTNRPFTMSSFPRSAIRFFRVAKATSFASATPSRTVQSETSRLSRLSLSAAATRETPANWYPSVAADPSGPARRKAPTSRPVPSPPTVPNGEFAGGACSSS